MGGSKGGWILLLPTVVCTNCMWCNMSYLVFSNIIYLFLLPLPNHVKLDWLRGFKVHTQEYTYCYYHNLNMTKCDVFSNSTITIECTVIYCKFDNKNYSNIVQLYFLHELRCHGIIFSYCGYYNDFCANDCNLFQCWSNDNFLLVFLIMNTFSLECSAE